MKDQIAFEFTGDAKITLELNAKSARPTVKVHVQGDPSDLALLLIAALAENKKYSIALDSAVGTIKTINEVRTNGSFSNHSMTVSAQAGGGKLALKMDKP